jgi:uncharacterized protein with HEPN domain
MNERDVVLLRSMLDSAHFAQEYTQDQTREVLNDDTMRLHALEHVVAIIGEAASKVSEQVRVANPQIPWIQIIGMCHRLIHGYLDVNVDRLWDTVQVSIPALITELEKLLLPETGDET